MTPAKTLLERLSTPGELLVANAPDGLDAWVLAGLLGEIGRASLLQVARDDARMAQLADAVGFFAPEAEIVQIPAWDCLPYDRVGPHRDIVARRIDGLSRLIEQPTPARPRLVLTTINGLLQRPAAARPAGRPGAQDLGWPAARPGGADRLPGAQQLSAQRHGQ